MDTSSPWGSCRDQREFQDLPSFSSFSHVDLVVPHWISEAFDAIDLSSLNIAAPVSEETHYVAVASPMQMAFNMIVYT